jgi:hypothetical protein
VRFVPSWFPGAEFQRTAKEFKNARVDDYAYLWARERIVGAPFFFQRESGLNSSRYPETSTIHSLPNYFVPRMVMFLMLRKKISSNFAAREYTLVVLTL